jgi:hypothetical protein
MAFIPGSETHPISDAQSVSNNRLFDVIQIADSNGNIIDPASGDLVLNGNVTVGGEMEIKNDSGNPVPIVAGLSIPKHDYVSLSYTGSNLTGVVYKTGGAGGTTVATLTLAYNGNNNLTSVTKS